jgi:cytochrome b involved in lipid metabolism
MAIESDYINIMARPAYFLPSEVAIHNVESDCWVSLLGNVYDLTPLLAQHKGSIFYTIFIR